MNHDPVLNESNKLDSIINTFDYGISMLDRTYKIVYQNHIMKDMFGGTGRKCYSVYEGKKKKCRECPVEKTFKDGHSHSSRRSVRRRSGNVEQWEYTSSPIKNDLGSIVACLETRKNITAQMDLELSLQDSRQNWKDVFDTLTDAITIHDENFYIVSSNKAAKELLSLKPSFAGNGKVKCFKQFHGTDRPPEECPSCACLKSGIPATFELFEPHLKKFLEIRAIPRMNGKKEVRGMIHLVRDITKKRELENVLKVSRDDLMMKTKKLEETNTALKVLLEKREMDRKELEDKVNMNVKTLIRPYIRKLKQSKLESHCSDLINSLDFNLKEITSSFSLRASSSLANLTPTEIRIANLIKEDKQSKEIADMMSISLDTVNTHRQNIRKKFGLKNGKVNLRTFLLSLED